jgi:hypothetical protein
MLAAQIWASLTPSLSFAFTMTSTLPPPGTSTFEVVEPGVTVIMFPLGNLKSITTDGGVPSDDGITISWPTRQLEHPVIGIASNATSAVTMKQRER